MLKKKDFLKKYLRFSKLISKFILFLYLFINFVVPNKIVKYKNNKKSFNNDEIYNSMKLNLDENDNIFDDLLSEYYKKMDFYKFFKFPLISIIIQIQNNLCENETKIFLNNLNESKKRDYLEIIFSIPGNNHKINNTIKKYADFFNQINIFTIINKQINNYNNIFQLIKKCKGKFVIFINDFYLITSNEIDNIYHYLNGKIDYIYQYFMKNSNKSFFIIKTKIIRDIFDNEIYFERFDELINIIQSFPKKNLNYISIALCIDNNYILNAYVAIISILENKNYNTYISFYILISKDFTNDNIDIILNLYEQYDFFNITFFRMDNRFDNVKMFRYITKSDYFKLALDDYLKNINKVIYLDCDVIVYKDLFNLYEHNFNGKLILAIPTVFIGNQLISKDIYYNGGVLLLNLKKMREIKFNKKVLEILDSGFKDTFNKWNDQAILNKFFYKYIGNLEPKYNSKLDLFVSNLKFYLDNNDSFNLINLIYSEKFPFIFHFTGKNKPYTIKRKRSDDWWFYAKKGKYLKILLKKNNISFS